MNNGWKRKIEKWFVRSTSWKQSLGKCALPAEIFSSRPRTNLLQTCYKFWICNPSPDLDYKSEQILIFVASLYGANVATNTFFRFYVFTHYPFHVHSHSKSHHPSSSQPVHTSEAQISITLSLYFYFSTVIISTTSNFLIKLPRSTFRFWV